MIQERVITNFGKYSDFDIETEARIIIDSCTDNPNFSITETLLTEATAALTAYSGCLRAAQDGGKIATIQKNESKEVLIGNLHTIALEVNLKCAGDKVKLISSGIKLIGDETPDGVAITEAVMAKNTEISGDIEVWVNTTKFRHYGTEFAFCIAREAGPDINKWYRVHANGHKARIPDLSPGTIIRLSAAYKLRDGEELVWCKPIEIMVT